MGVLPAGLTHLTFDSAFDRPSAAGVPAGPTQVEMGARSAGWHGLKHPTFDQLVHETTSADGHECIHTFFFKDNLCSLYYLPQKVND